MRKIIVLICLLLLVGCKGKYLGEMEPIEITPLLKELCDSNSNISCELVNDSSTQAIGLIMELIEETNRNLTDNIRMFNTTILGVPNHDRTLNMSELIYRGEEVKWVYQMEEPVSKWTIRVVPCIMLKNESRYCKE